MTPIMMTFMMMMVPQDGSVACLVLGTESSSVYILDPEVVLSSMLAGLLLQIYSTLY